MQCKTQLKITVPPMCVFSAKKECFLKKNVLYIKNKTLLNILSSEVNPTESIKGVCPSQTILSRFILKN